MKIIYKFDLYLVRQSYFRPYAEVFQTVVAAIKVVTVTHLKVFIFLFSEVVAFRRYNATLSGLAQMVCQTESGNRHFIPLIVY